MPLGLFLYVVSELLESHGRPKLQKSLKLAIGLSIQPNKLKLATTHVVSFIFIEIWGNESLKKQSRFKSVLRHLLKKRRGNQFHQ